MQKVLPEGQVVVQLTTVEQWVQVTPRQLLLLKVMQEALRLETIMTAAPAVAAAALAVLVLLRPGLDAPPAEAPVETV
jgi:hypothetical protein